MYEVIMGSLEKRGDHWDIDGMRASQRQEFESLEEARAFLGELDLEGDFERELETTSAPQAMRSRGFYAELVDENGEGIDWAEFTYDDHTKR